MKTQILLCLLVVSLAGFAQRKSIYAITDITPGGAAWLNIKEVQPEGAEGKFILKNQEFDGTRFDLATQAKSAVSVRTLANGNDLPLNSGVAALAFDPNHNRLYFSTMFTGDIRYISLKENNSYYQVGNVFSSIPQPNNVPINSNNQGPVITRMTVGADGNVYGLSNNGDAFFRVSTQSKKATIENLGKLSDDPSNNGMSIHTSCSSWGGDMIAAADGSIYVFSMYQHIFQVNPTTRVAKYIGKIEGLPANFSVNGAAVNEEGGIVLSSATLASKVAVIADPEQILKATIKDNQTWMNASDLASGNLLFAKKGDVVFSEFDRSTGQSGVGVFPNPVSNGQVIVHFKEGMQGKHTLDLLDIAGSPKMQSFVNLNGEAQRITLHTGVLASGLYLLRVTNGGKKEVETIKVLVQ
jgi:hypothetical protein